MKFALHVQFQRHGPYSQLKLDQSYTIKLSRTSGQRFVFSQKGLDESHMIFMCEWTNETCYTSSRFVLCHPVQVQRSQMQIVRTPPWDYEH